jgi:RNA polymerase sigma-70 factor (ECF subfamily)
VLGRIAVDDAELVLSARAGDAAAFATLIGRYETRIVRLVRGMVPESDTEDVTQEAFLKAYRKLGDFDGRSSFYTWIYRIAANTAMDWRKKARHRRHAPLPEGPEGEDTVASRDAGPESATERRELGARIDAAIESLPDKYHEILVLREIEELSYEDIAARLSISKGTVESRLFRAREKLREKLVPWMKP